MKIVKAVPRDPSVQPLEEYQVFERIGPSEAREYLKGNTGNRRPRRATVARYASEMKAGRWRKTHQGIAIAEDGRVVDGQHRLLAVVDSGATIVLSVTHNADATTFPVIDHNQVRTTPDAFGIRFRVDDPRAPAAVSRAAIVRVRSVGGVPFAQISDDAAMEFYEDNRAVVDRMIDAFGKRLPSAVTGCAVNCVLDGFANAPDVCEIGLRMRERDWRGRGDPLLRLHEVLAGTKRLEGGERYRLAVTAFAAALRGRKLSLLRPSQKDWHEGPGQGGSH